MGSCLHLHSMHWLGPAQTGATAQPASMRMVRDVSMDRGPKSEAVSCAGRFIGTLLPCCWLVVIMSFMPTAVVRRIFPPFVPGVTIFLIGEGTGLCQASNAQHWWRLSHSAYCLDRLAA